MTTTATRATKSSTLTAKEQADLIRRFFPALMPYFDKQEQRWIAPSCRIKTLSYMFQAKRSADGTFTRTCSCPARRECKHLILADLPNHPTEGEYVFDEATFNTRYAHLMKSEVA